MKYPTIKIDGKEHSFLMGRGAINAYAYETGKLNVKTKDLDAVLLNMSLEERNKFDWICFKTASAATGVDFPYDFDEYKELIAKKPHIIDEVDAINEMQMPDVDMFAGGNTMEAASH